MKRLLIGTALILAAVAEIQAAPARAIYFVGGGGISKMDPDGTNETLLIPGASGKLQLDSPNGHIYYGGNGKVHRGNVDGSGAHEIYAGTAFTDFVIDIANQKIFFFRQRAGIFEYDIVGGSTSPVYETSSPIELISGSIHFDQDASKVYWIENTSGSHLYTRDIAGNSQYVDALPVNQFSLGQTTTELLFDSGTPIPCSLALRSNQQNSVISIGGLDGNAPSLGDVPVFRDLEIRAVAADLDGGFFYMAGSLYREGEGSPPPPDSIFRAALDGSGFTSIRGGNTPFAIDTADLEDETAPVVTILSPIGGTTNSRTAAIFGTVSDDSPISTVRWFHNGVEQGAAEILDGTFSVPSVTLHPGENLLGVSATDLAGNSATADVTLNWEPLRQVTLASNATVREGQRVSIDTSLQSSGEIAGMTFKLIYDPVRFEAPKIDFDDAISGLAPSVNTLTAGEITVTFASATETVATGEQVLMTTSLRARSIETTGDTDITIQIDDIADANGNPIITSTYAGGATLSVVGRTFTGDVNANDRLDTGDATVMQSMLTGASEKRTWDDQLNDLNNNANLDSGDVIRVLRAVVGIVPQPSLPQARSLRSSSQDDPDAPRAQLTLSENHAAPGSAITLSVTLVNPGTAFSGASFTLDYPSEYLRLETSADHSPGAIVGGDSFVLWNVSPSQNNYVEQDGSIRFAASAPSDWPSSSAGGIVAEFEFTVTAANAGKVLEPITVHDFEISTDAGFETIPVTGVTTPWITSAQTFSIWQSTNFTQAELEDPTISAPDADKDKDGFSNAVEFISGTDPGAAESAPRIDVTVTDQHCLSISYPRAPWAIGASVSIQVSTDMTNWQDVADPALSTSVDYSAGIESITAELDPAPSGVRQYARLHFELAE